VILFFKASLVSCAWKLPVGARHRLVKGKGYPVVKVLMPGGKVKDPNGEPNPNSEIKVSWPGQRN
jgi:hypothetical protein